MSSKRVVVSLDKEENDRLSAYESRRGDFRYYRGERIRKNLPRSSTEINVQVGGRGRHEMLLILHKTALEERKGRNVARIPSLRGGRGSAWAGWEGAPSTTGQPLKVTARK